MTDTGKILVVDDSKSVRDVLERQLRYLGYECDTVDSGASALMQLQQTHYDALLVDLVMPEMDGLELLSRILKEKVQIAPIALSGKSSVSMAVEAMKRGAYDYVLKGANSDQLRDVLNRTLRQFRLQQHSQRMEKAVHLWETTFNAVPDLIAIINTKCEFVRMNQAMANRLGKPISELLGKKCFTLVHKSGKPHPDCPYQKLLCDKQEHVGEFFERNLGGSFLVSTSPLRDAQGELLGCVHVARDVTEQKRTEEQLRNAHMETENLLSSMSSILIEVDVEGRVSRWNNAAETVFGIPAEQVLLKPFLSCSIQWDWDRVREQLPLWSSCSEPMRLADIGYMRPDGRQGILALSVNPLRNHQEQSAGFFLLGSDITDRRSLEAQLVQAQKLESIGQLAAGIAHEINTPTQYVGDNIQFLQDAFGEMMRLSDKSKILIARLKEKGEELALVEEIEALAQEVDLSFLEQEIPKAIEQSLEGVERTAKIVRAMKEFSHPGTEKKTPVNLNRAIESTITVARNEWKYVAEMETVFDTHLPLVSCLPGEFNRLF